MLKHWYSRYTLPIAVDLSSKQSTIFLWSIWTCFRTKCTQSIEPEWWVLFYIPNWGHKNKVIHFWLLSVSLSHTVLTSTCYNHSTTSLSSSHPSCKHLCQEEGLVNISWRRRFKRVNKQPNINIMLDALETSQNFLIQKKFQKKLGRCVILPLFFDSKIEMKIWSLLRTSQVRKY